VTDIEARLAELERRMDLADKKDADLAAHVIGLNLEPSGEEATDALFDGLFRVIWVLAAATERLRVVAGPDHEDLLATVEARLESLDAADTGPSNVDWRGTILTAFEVCRHTGENDLGRVRQATSELMKARPSTGRRPGGATTEG